MSKIWQILLTFLFGFVSVQGFAIESRLGGVDDEIYSQYVCNGKQNGNRIMVPGTCTQYYECQSGQSVMRTCASPNKFFDSSSGNCVATSSCIEPKGDCSTAKPKPTPPCKNKSTPSSTTTSTTLTTPTTQSTTSSTSTSTKEPTTTKPTTPHLTPCERKRQEQQQKLLESLEKQYEELFATGGQRCDSPGGSCRALKNGSTIPYKSDCNKYLVCINGCGAEVLCPAFLHFNPKTLLCDKPENAACSF